MFMQSNESNVIDSMCIYIYIYIHTFVSFMGPVRGWFHLFGSSSGMITSQAHLHRRKILQNDRRGHEEVAKNASVTKRFAMH